MKLYRLSVWPASPMSDSPKLFLPLNDPSTGGEGIATPSPRERAAAGGGRGVWSATPFADVEPTGEEVFASL